MKGDWRDFKNQKRLNGFLENVKMKRIINKFNIQKSKDIQHLEIVLHMLQKKIVLPSFYPNPLDLADPEVYQQFGKQLYNRVKF